MDNEELVRALISAKDAHIADLQQTIGMQMALSGRMLNALIPTPVPAPSDDEGKGDD